MPRFIDPFIVLLCTYNWFFSRIVTEKGPRIQGVEGPRV
ncbi:hypothetical protein D3OALGA1CA_1476 [Olavius algarvensis associated proteobacterium Delta 3]|nr:hypothetical protein D3OALGB2SA_924 [Olavius algarvensis associated proteobacterium Delta 3]CAB5101616.1 hypothetical protein D3OALGA1CA_1476 [Olavius algarvensis associated proteobacterium Delta 3]